jgi:MFS family permease
MYSRSCALTAALALVMRGDREDIPSTMPDTDGGSSAEMRPSDDSFGSKVVPISPVGLCGADYAPMQELPPHPAAYYQKNVVWMSGAFFLAYTAFSGIQNLAGAVIGDAGSVGLGLLYLIFTLTCISGPNVLQILGVKKTLTGAFCLLTFNAICATIVQHYSADTTFVWVLWLIACAAVGVAASALWTAQGAYLTCNSELYSRAKGEDPASSLGHFNGIFFCIFQCTQLSSNLSASLLPKVPFTSIARSHSRSTPR